jgi:geranylgeranylglycerol-phosphate geranylgeranyltransferase
MDKLAAAFLLIRPLNFLITFSVIAAAYLISSENGYSVFILLSAGLSGAFTAASGNIVNDLFDIEADRINHPERPLASNRISYNAAKSVWFLCTLVSFILSSLISFYAFLFILLIHIVLIMYSYKFKSFAFSGNLTIALLTSAAFIYGGFSAGNLKFVVIPAVFAFLINYVREIVKDIQDIKGDLTYGLITLPVKIGIVKTKKIILGFISVIIILSLFLFYSEYYSIEFLIVMMIIVNPLLVYCVRILFSTKSDNSYRKISRILKFNMAAGLIAIYFGR